MQSSVPAITSAPDVTSPFTSKSKLMQDLQAKISKVAPTLARVLILGPNGSGKQVAADQIYANSLRRSRQFITINCGAIPETLLESELFGHEKGSFTGAANLKRGKFELADAGTLFLDEIGDMSLQMQVKLLRVLQTGEFERVGGSQTLKSDCRVISATNKDLKSEIKAGRFREDLYHRIATVPLVVPPLRDRKEDILFLANRFLYEVNASHMVFDAPAALELVRYDYPGNVRELRSIVERVSIFSSADTITRDDVRHCINLDSFEILPICGDSDDRLFESISRFVDVIGRMK